MVPVDVYHLSTHHLIICTNRMCAAETRAHARTHTHTPGARGSICTNRVCAAARQLRESEGPCRRCRCPRPLTPPLLHLCVCVWRLTPSLPPSLPPSLSVCVCLCLCLCLCLFRRGTDKGERQRERKKETREKEGNQIERKKERVLFRRGTSKGREQEDQRERKKKTKKKGVPW